MFGILRDVKDKNRVILAAVAGTASLLALGYFAYNAKQRISQGRCPITGRSKAEAALASHGCPISRGKLSGEAQYEDFKMKNLQRVVSLKKSALLEDKQKVLTYETLTAIQEIAVEITCKDLRQVLIVQRQKRRTIKDKKAYEDAIIKHVTQVESMYKDNLSEILKDTGVGRDKYEASMAEHVKLDVSVAMVGTHLYRVLVSRVQSISPPDRQTKELAIQVLNFMIEEYKKIMSPPIHLEYYAEVKEAHLLDRVHEQFDLEEEDLQQLRRKQNSEEVRDLVKTLETEVMHDIKHRIHYLNGV